jgi:flagellar assembly protein FliH
MSSVIPKEKLSAYQRWEMASFDERPPPTPEEIAAQLTKANEEVKRAAYAAGLAEGRNAGFAEGRAAGLEEGRAAGMEQGHAAGLAQGRAQAEAERLQLQQVAHAFGDEVAQASERIAADVLTLALDLAKGMLKNALSIRPELVIPVVSEAIRYLPTLHQPALLFLHPADAVLVREQLGDEMTKAGWRVAEDAHIERGGCRVETATNQIDATTETRWHRLAAALGKDSDWLE